MAVQIHGKAYVTCAERLQMAMESGKAIEMLSSEPLAAGDRWLWRCTIKIDDKQYIGSAEVHLNAKPGSADATDPWACGETSAMARALGWAGFGVIEGIASADEIMRVQSQPIVKPSDVEKVKGYVARVFNFGDDVEKRWESYKAYRLKAPIADPDLTINDINALRNYAVSHENKPAVAVK